MALRIIDVKITTDYTWQNIKNQADWRAVRDSNNNYQQILQTATPGGNIKVEVEVSENNWLSIKDNHSTWQRVKEKFASWFDINSY